MMKTKAFKGSTVFMSRNLVPPEVFDKLHGVLKDNGADVFLCCDPSRNGPDDFHVISSIDHEKFEDLRAKGCNLIGPQCVLSCAKENRALPKEGFTCCFAMDGLKILASGFEMEEKIKIEKLVAAMGGALHSKASLDVSFVIVKNVLAAKYKWASNSLKKPIVTIHWLYQCWNEHRVVPQESYRVLPFFGLTICVSRIPADERKKVEKQIIQNGGKYSPELTKKCTHLICDIPEGDKYKVARRWGHIRLVTQKWFDQSIIKRACLHEESYPVQVGHASANKSVKSCMVGQHCEDRSTGNLQSVASCTPSELSSHAVPSRFEDPDLEATHSQNMSSKLSDVWPINEAGDGGEPNLECSSEVKFDGFVANDSQSEDSDLYLSDCRILLVGFEATEMRKLVRSVRKGGASRYMLFSDKLTHIVVGTPSEVEKKQIRSLAASGVIQVVKAIWLEDCHRAKKEIPVQQKHIYDFAFPKDSLNSTKGPISNFIGSSLNKSSVPNSEIDVSSPFGKNEDDKKELNINKYNLLNATMGSSEQALPAKNDDRPKMQHDSVLQASKNMTSSNVFKGKRFCFSNSFPEDRRGEIVQWVDQGGGEIIDDQVKQNVDFIIECHGVKTRSAVDANSYRVSTHWVRSCLEDGSLLDVGSHILYSPLPCQIPFPGFENFRFCVSQYEEKERLLLRNLCFVLGAKFVEKLTKRVTHLLCKFTNGPKYEAACKWGIHLVTSEWIYECVSQDRLVPLEPFFPKEVTAEDREAGLCTVSQFPTQAGRLKCGDNQREHQSQDLRTTQGHASDVKSLSNSSGIISRVWEEEKQANSFNKKPKFMKEDYQNDLASSVSCSSDAVRNENPIKDNKSKCTGEALHVVPDVATAIEDLLEQTSKIHDQKSKEISGCDKSIFSSEHTTSLGQGHSDSHSIIGLSRQWLNRTPRKDATYNHSGDNNAGLYDGFSETQTDSQVVGYEEDLSGRQMLIDRVRTRSSMA